MIIIIVLLVIMIFLLTTIKLTIYNVLDKTDVKIKFGIFFYFHLDYEGFVQFFSIYRDDEKKISLRAFYQNMISIFSKRKIIKDLAKSIQISELIVISKNNAENPILESYINCFSLITFSLIKEFLNSNFKSVKNDVYQILLNDQSLNKINYDFDYKIELKMRIFTFIYYLIRNIKSVIHLFKNQVRS